MIRIIIKNIIGVKKADNNLKYSELEFHLIFFKKQSNEKALLKSRDKVDA